MYIYNFLIFPACRLALSNHPARLLLPSSFAVASFPHPASIQLFRAPHRARCFGFDLWDPVTPFRTYLSSGILGIQASKFFRHLFRALYHNDRHRTPIYAYLLLATPLSSSLMVVPRFFIWVFTYAVDVRSCCQRLHWGCNISLVIHANWNSFRGSRDEEKGEGFRTSLELPCLDRVGAYLRSGGV